MTEENGKKRGVKQGGGNLRLWWPLHHCQQSTARMPTAGTPHARAKNMTTVLSEACASVKAKGLTGAQGPAPIPAPAPKS